MARQRGLPRTGARIRRRSWTELGLAVQHQRLALGLTLRALADELGASASSLSRVERGVMGPGDHAPAIAAWLGWPVADVHALGQPPAGRSRD